MWDRSSTFLRVRCTPGGTLQLSRPGRCCSSPRRGSRDSLRRRGCRGVTSPPRRRLPHRRTFRGFWRSGGGTIPHTRLFPPGKTTVLAPYGRCEIGADVGGYPRINEACLEEGESLEEVGGDHGDGNGGAGGGHAGAGPAEGAGGDGGLRRDAVLRRGLFCFAPRCGQIAVRKGAFSGVHNPYWRRCI